MVEDHRPRRFANVKEKCKSFWRLIKKCRECRSTVGVLTNICAAQNRPCSALSTASSVNGPGRWIRSPPSIAAAADPVPVPVPPPPAAVYPAIGPGGNDRWWYACPLFVSVFCSVAAPPTTAAAFAHVEGLAGCPSSLPLNSTLSATKQTSHQTRARTRVHGRRLDSKKVAPFQYAICRPLSTIDRLR